jgi:hypothetical protein
MPAAWFGMLSLGLALAARLGERHIAVATSFVTVATGAYIPAYEVLARSAGWWSYARSALLFGAVPPYIVLGELLLALPLAGATRLLAELRWPAAAGLGAAQGLWIFVSYRAAWGVTGP